MGQGCPERDRQRVWKGRVGWSFIAEVEMAGQVPGWMQSVKGTEASKVCPVSVSKHLSGAF